MSGNDIGSASLLNCKLSIYAAQGATCCNTWAVGAAATEIPATWELCVHLYAELDRRVMIIYAPAGQTFARHSCPKITQQMDVVLNSSAKPKAVGLPCASPLPPCAVLVFGHAGKHANYKTWCRQGFLGVS